MSLESIEEEGPGGNFLLEEETMERYREEIYYPELYNIENYDQWEREGKISVEEKARKKVEERLAQYEPPQYTEKQKKVLEEALKGFENL